MQNQLSRSGLEVLVKVLLLLLFLRVDFSTEAADGQRSSLHSKPAPLEHENGSGRLTVALLGFENKTGDADLEFWRVGIERLVSSELTGIGAIRVEPGVEYARRQIHKKEGEGLEPEEAKKAGEAIEARRVIWGEYKREGNNWVVTARVMNVATGKVSTNLVAKSGDWFTIRDVLTEKILGELNAKPTGKERRSLGKRWTKNPDTLEWFTKGKFYYAKPNHQPDAEKCVRQAVAADPKCGHAYSALAVVLGTAGKLEEAERAGRKGVELRPDSSYAHSALAHVLVLKGDASEGRRELEKSLELYPEDKETLEGLGEVFGLSGDWNKALEYFLKTSKIDAYSASANAHVGYAYAHMGERDKALASLRKAESLVSPDGDVGAEQFLYYGFFTLREIPQTIEHAEKLVKAGKEQGVGPKLLEEFEDALPDLRARLMPTYVEAVVPKSYTEESLTDVLRDKLTPDELKNAINPTAITSDMKKWAHELTAGATNDFEKGRMLLEALSRHTKNGFGGRRTAQQVFLAWPDAHSSFLCEEYTYIYIALAREVGLKCFYTYVDQVCDGRKSLHACAAVFLGEKCLLADPPYYWFGVPHKKYAVLNDLDVVAVRLAESHSGSDCRAAYKLAPNLDYVRCQLIDALMSDQNWDEAQKLFADAPLSNPMFANGIQADFAVHDGKLSEAIEILGKTIESYPDVGELRANLGRLYMRQESFADARAEFRKALPELYVESTVEQVHFLLAQINEKLGESPDLENPNDYVGYRGRGDFDLSKDDYDKAIADYTEAIRLNPNDAGSFYGRAYAHASKHEIPSTIQDCTKALAIDAEKAEVYELRAGAYWKDGKLTKALGDLEQAIKLAPSRPDAYEQRGDMYRRRGEYAKAANDFREVARLRPNDPDSQIGYAWLLVKSDDKSVQSGVAAMQAAKTACELGSWTNSANIEILAAACAMAGDYDHAVDYVKRAANFEGLKDEDRERMLKALWRYDDDRLRHDSTNRPPVKSESSSRVR